METTRRFSILWLAALSLLLLVLAGLPTSSTAERGTAPLSPPVQFVDSLPAAADSHVDSANPSENYGNADTIWVYYMVGDARFFVSAL
jgi:hypothetical protein